MMELERSDDRAHRGSIAHLIEKSQIEPPPTCDRFHYHRIPSMIAEATMYKMRVYDR